MANLIDAGGMYVGSTAATAVYLGTSKVWPAAAPTGPAKLATFTETFDTYDSSKWTLPAPAAGRFTGGQLVLDSRADYAGYIYSTAFYDITDSYSAVQVVSTAVAANGGAYTNLEFGVQRVAGTSVSVDIEVGGGTNRLVMFTPGGGTAGSVPYDAATMGWLRIRASGGVVYGDSSPDGSAWTQRFSWTATFDLTSVQLFIGGGSDNTAGTMIFDNLNVGSVAPPVSAALAPSTSLAPSTTLTPKG